MTNNTNVKFSNFKRCAFFNEGGEWTDFEY